MDVTHCNEYDRKRMERTEVPTAVFLNIQGYDAVSIGGCFPTFRKNLCVDVFNSEAVPEDLSAQWHSSIEMDIGDIKFLNGRPRKVFKNGRNKTARRGEVRCGHSRGQASGHMVSR